MAAHVDETRPQPVIDAAKVAGAVSGVVVAVGGVLLLLGYATAEDVQGWSVALGGVVTAGMTAVSVILPIIKGQAAAEVVTPLSAPQDNDGTPLVPEPDPYEMRG